MTLGQQGQLTATITPANATNQNLIWSNSNPSVATIDDRGIITTRAVGTTVITVTTEDGNHSASATISVNPIPVRSVSLSDGTIGTTTNIVVGIAIS